MWFMIHDWQKMINDELSWIIIDKWLYHDLILWSSQNHLLSTAEIEGLCLVEFDKEDDGKTFDQSWWNMSPYSQCLHVIQLKCSRLHDLEATDFVHQIFITPTLVNDFEGVLGVWKSFLKIIFFGAIFFI